MITLNQTHSKTFHCTYLLHYYPFDTQVFLLLCVDLLLLFLAKLRMSVAPGVQGGLAASEVCPGQCGAGARHHRAAD